MFHTTTSKRAALVSLVANHPHDAVWRALCNLSSCDNWEDANITRWLNPNHVLARPWNGFRLDRARRMLANGDIAPIQVIGYRIGDGTALYECDDGIHRTTAAREAGRKIKAAIKGYYQLGAARNFIICRNQLWKPRPQEPGWLTHVADVTEDTRPVLIALGVVEKTDSQ
jgi:hypothetical protein